MVECRHLKILPMLTWLLTLQNLYYLCEISSIGIGKHMERIHTSQIVQLINQKYKSAEWTVGMTGLSIYTVCHFANDLMWRAIACGDIFFFWHIQGQHDLSIPPYAIRSIITHSFILPISNRPCVWLFLSQWFSPSSLRGAHNHCLVHVQCQVHFSFALAAPFR